MAYGCCNDLESIKRSVEKICRENGDVDQLAFLLRRNKNFDVNATSYDGWAPLHLAAFAGHAKVVEFLVFQSNADPWCRTSVGVASVPLHLACWGASIDVAKLLIERAGADLNERSQDGNTPLHYVCWSDSYELCEYLLGVGADMQVKNIEGFTPLILAAAWDKVKAMECLLKVARERGSLSLLVSDTDSAGNTALHHAAKEGSLNGVKILLRYRSNPLKANKAGQSPIALCGVPEVKAHLIRASKKGLGKIEEDGNGTDEMKVGEDNNKCTENAVVRSAEEIMSSTQQHPITGDCSVQQVGINPSEAEEEQITTVGRESEVLNTMDQQSAKDITTLKVNVLLDGVNDSTASDRINESIILVSCDNVNISSSPDAIDFTESGALRSLFSTQNDGPHLESASAETFFSSSLNGSSAGCPDDSLADKWHADISNAQPPIPLSSASEDVFETDTVSSVGAASASSAPSGSLYQESRRRGLKSQNRRRPSQPSQSVAAAASAYMAALAASTRCASKSTAAMSELIRDVDQPDEKSTTGDDSVGADADKSRKVLGNRVKQLAGSFLRRHGANAVDSSQSAESRTKTGASEKGVPMKGASRNNDAPVESDVKSLSPAKSYGKIETQMPLKEASNIDVITEGSIPIHPGKSPQTSEERRVTLEENSAEMENREEDSGDVNLLLKRIGKIGEESHSHSVSASNVMMMHKSTVLSNSTITTQQLPLSLKTPVKSIKDDMKTTTSAKGCEEKETSSSAKCAAILDNQNPGSSVKGSHTSNERRPNLSQSKSPSYEQSPRLLTASLSNDPTVIPHNTDTKLDLYPLHKAVRDGRVEDVRALLTNGRLGEVNKYDDEGFTPLHYACMANNAPAAALLIVMGSADVSRRTRPWMKGEFNGDEHYDSADESIVTTSSMGSKKVGGTMGLTPLQLCRSSGPLRRLIQAVLAFRSCRDRSARKDAAMAVDASVKDALMSKHEAAINSSPSDMFKPPSTSLSLPPGGCRDHSAHGNLSHSTRKRSMESKDERNDTPSLTCPSGSATANADGISCRAMANRETASKLTEREGRAHHSPMPTQKRDFRVSRGDNSPLPDAVSFASPRLSMGPLLELRQTLRRHSRASPALSPSARSDVTISTKESYSPEAYGRQRSTSACAMSSLTDTNSIITGGSRWVTSTRVVPPPKFDPHSSLDAPDHNAAVVVASARADRQLYGWPSRATTPSLLWHAQKSPTRFGSKAEASKAHPMQNQCRPTSLDSRSSRGRIEFPSTHGMEQSKKLAVPIPSFASAAVKVQTVDLPNRNKGASSTLLPSPFQMNRDELVKQIRKKFADSSLQNELRYESMQGLRSSGYRQPSTHHPSTQLDVQAISHPEKQNTVQCTEMPGHSPAASSSTALANQDCHFCNEPESDVIVVDSANANDGGPNAQSGALEAEHLKSIVVNVMSSTFTSSEEAKPQEEALRPTKDTSFDELGFSPSLTENVVGSQRPLDAFSCNPEDRDGLGEQDNFFRNLVGNIPSSLCPNDSSQISDFSSIGDSCKITESSNKSDFAAVIGPNGIRYGKHTVASLEQWYEKALSSGQFDLATSIAFFLGQSPVSCVTSSAKQNRRSQSSHSSMGSSANIAKKSPRLKPKLKEKPVESYRRPTMVSQMKVKTQSPQRSTKVALFPRLSTCSPFTRNPVAVDDRESSRKESQPAPRTSPRHLSTAEVAIAAFDVQTDNPLQFESMSTRHKVDTMHSSSMPSSKSIPFGSLNGARSSYPRQVDASSTDVAFERISISPQNNSSAVHQNRHSFQELHPPGEESMLSHVRHVEDRTHHRHHENQPDRTTRPLMSSIEATPAVTKECISQLTVEVNSSSSPLHTQLLPQTLLEQQLHDNIRMSEKRGMVDKCVVGKPFDAKSNEDIIPEFYENRYHSYGDRCKSGKTYDMAADCISTAAQASMPMNPLLQSHLEHPVVSSGANITKDMRVNTVPLNSDSTVPSDLSRGRIDLHRAVSHDSYDDVIQELLRKQSFFASTGREPHRKPASTTFASCYQQVRARASSYPEANSYPEARSYPEALVQDPQICTEGLKASTEAADILASCSGSSTTSAFSIPSVDVVGPFAHHIRRPPAFLSTSIAFGGEANSRQQQEGDKRYRHRTPRNTSEDPKVEVNLNTSRSPTRSSSMHPAVNSVSVKLNDGHVDEAEIDRIVTAGLVSGCTPDEIAELLLGLLCGDEQQPKIQSQSGEHSWKASGAASDLSSRTPLSSGSQTREAACQTEVSIFSVDASQDIATILPSSFLEDSANLSRSPKPSMIPVSQRPHDVAISFQIAPPTSVFSSSVPGTVPTNAADEINTAMTTSGENIKVPMDNHHISPSAKSNPSETVLPSSSSSSSPNEVFMTPSRAIRSRPHSERLALPLNTQKVEENGIKLPSPKKTAMVRVDATAADCDRHVSIPTCEPALQVHDSPAHRDFTEVPTDASVSTDSMKSSSSARWPSFHPLGSRASQSEKTLKNPSSFALDLELSIESSIKGLDASYAVDSAVALRGPRSTIGTSNTNSSIATTAVEPQPTSETTVRSSAVNVLALTLGKIAGIYSNSIYRYFYRWKHAHAQSHERRWKLEGIFGRTESSVEVKDVGDEGCKAVVAPSTTSADVISESVPNLPPEPSSDPTTTGITNKRPDTPLESISSCLCTETSDSNFNENSEASSLSSCKITVGSVEAPVEVVVGESQVNVDTLLVSPLIANEVPFASIAFTAKTNEEGTLTVRSSMIKSSTEVIPNVSSTVTNALETGSTDVCQPDSMVLQSIVNPCTALQTHTGDESASNFNTVFATQSHSERERSHLYLDASSPLGSSSRKLHTICRDEDSSCRAYVVDEEEDAAASRSFFIVEKRDDELVPEASAFFDSNRPTDDASGTKLNHTTSSIINSEDQKSSNLLGQMSENAKNVCNATTRDINADLDSKAQFMIDVTPTASVPPEVAGDVEAIALIASAQDVDNDQEVIDKPKSSRRHTEYDDENLPHLIVNDKADSILDSGGSARKDAVLISRCEEFQASEPPYNRPTSPSKEILPVLSSEDPANKLADEPIHHSDVEAGAIGTSISVPEKTEVEDQVCFSTHSSCCIEGENEHCDDTLKLAVNTECNVGQNGTRDDAATRWLHSKASEIDLSCGVMSSPEDKAVVASDWKILLQSVDPEEQRCYNAISPLIEENEVVLWQVFKHFAEEDRMDANDSDAEPLSHTGRVTVPQCSCLCMARRLARVLGTKSLILLFETFGVCPAICSTEEIVVIARRVISTEKNIDPLVESTNISVSSGDLTCSSAPNLTKSSNCDNISAQIAAQLESFFDTSVATQDSTAVHIVTAISTEGSAQSQDSRQVSVDMHHQCSFVDFIKVLWIVASECMVSSASISPESRLARLLLSMKQHWTRSQKVAPSVWPASLSHVSFTFGPMLQELAARRPAGTSTSNKRLWPNTLALDNPVEALGKRRQSLHSHRSDLIAGVRITQGNDAALAVPTTICNSTATSFATTEDLALVNSERKKPKRHGSRKLFSEEDRTLQKLQQQDQRFTTEVESGIACPTPCTEDPSPVTVSTI